MSAALKYGEASRMFKATDETTSHLTKLAYYANKVIGYALDITALLKDSKSSCTKVHSGFSSFHALFCHRS
jgi:hypothetical protein